MTTPKKTKKPAQKGRVRRTTSGSSKPAPKAHVRKSGPTGEPGPTLAELADGYLRHLEKTGKSPSTVFSYKMDLGIATSHFGDETLVATLAPESVTEFFGSDAVTKKKGGANKTEVTIKKAQRVLRQALAWAAETKLIESAPLP